MENIFEQEIAARKAADERVDPEQVALRPGDFCARVAHGIVIYSEILDAAAHLLGDRALEDLDEDEKEEYESVRDSYTEEHMKNYRFTRSYSSLCPNGELGDIHVSTVSRVISQKEFQSAKNRRWV